MIKPPPVIVELSKSYGEMYKHYLNTKPQNISYYQLVKGHNKKTDFGDHTVIDSDGGLLAFFLCERQYSEPLWSMLAESAYKEVKPKLLMRIACNALMVSIRLPQTKATKHDILEAADKAKDLSRFIFKNPYLHYKYRSIYSPVAAGTFLRNHDQYRRNKAGLKNNSLMKQRNFIAEALDIKNTVGKTFPDHWNEDEILFNYVSSVFPNLGEMLEMYANNLAEMVEKKPIQPRPNSDNAEFHLFVRLLRENFLQQFERPYYRLITTLAELLFSHIEVGINEDNIKRICRAKYDTK